MKICITERSTIRGLSWFIEVHDDNGKLDELSSLAFGRLGYLKREGAVKALRLIKAAIAASDDKVECYSYEENWKAHMPKEGER